MKKLFVILTLSPSFLFGQGARTQPGGTLTPVPIYSFDVISNQVFTLLSGVLPAIAFPTNEVWVDPVRGSASATGAYSTPLDNLTNALPLITARGGGTIHMSPGTTNIILTANNIVSNICIDGRGATISVPITNSVQPGIFIVLGNMLIKDVRYVGITNDFQLPFDFTYGLVNGSSITFDNVNAFNASDVIYDNGGTISSSNTFVINNCRFESYFDNIIITSINSSSWLMKNSTFRASNPYGAIGADGGLLGATERNIKLSGFSTSTFVFENCLVETYNGTNQNTCVEITTGSGHVQWHNSTLVSYSTNSPSVYFLLKGGTHDIYNSQIPAGRSSGTLNYFGPVSVLTTNTPMVGGFAQSNDGTNASWVNQTNEIWVDPNIGSVSNSGTFLSPLLNLTNALSVLSTKGGGLIHLVAGTTNTITTVSNVLNNITIDGKGAYINVPITNSSSPGIFVMKGNAKFMGFTYTGITNDFQLPFDFTYGLATGSSIEFDSVNMFNATDNFYDNGGATSTGCNIWIHNSRFESYFDNVAATSFSNCKWLVQDSIFKASNPYGTSALSSSGQIVRNIRMSSTGGSTFVFENCLVESLNGTVQNTCVDIGAGSGILEWHNCSMISYSTNAPATYLRLKGGIHSVYGGNVPQGSMNSGTVTYFDYYPSKTNTFTLSEIATNSFGMWNSNGLSSTNDFYISVNSNGVIQNLHLNFKP